MNRLQGSIEGQPLSPKERKILEARATGMSHTQVAYLFGNHCSTIKNLTGRAYTKLGVNCAEEAYIKLGWLNVDPGWSAAAAVQEQIMAVRVELRNLAKQALELAESLQ